MTSIHTKTILISLSCIILGIFLVIILDTARSYVLVRKGKVLAKIAVPFERAIPQAEMNILVLGDSTAYGTGAEKPEFSTAGRLGALYPEASVENLAVNGLKLDGLLKIVNNMDSTKYYSIILVQIGANDIIRLTSIKDVEIEADKIFALLSKRTDKLVVLHSGNVGDSRIFPFYLKALLSQRSFKMRDIYSTLAKRYNFEYVNLIDSPVNALLRDHPDTYYAADYLHLNGAGYKLWFDEIEKKL